MSKSDDTVEDCLKLARALMWEEEIYVACEIDEDDGFRAWVVGNGEQVGEVIGSGLTAHDALISLSEDLERWCNSVAEALKEVKSGHG